VKRLVPRRLAMIERIPQREMDDCVICVAAMVMAAPYTYERVLADSHKYQKTNAQGKFIPWWETYLSDEGFRLGHWQWAESDLDRLASAISGLRDDAAGILTMNIPDVQRRHLVAVDRMGIVDPATGEPTHENLHRYISKRKLQGILFDDRCFVTVMKAQGGKSNCDVR
jgi:hypothetical protein